MYTTMMCTGTGNPKFVTAIPPSWQTCNVKLLTAAAVKQVKVHVTGVATVAFISFFHSIESCRTVHRSCTCTDESVLHAHNQQLVRIFV